MNATFERFDLERIAPTPWKNGAGLTREIALAPAGAGGFDWRLSLAEVERDAPFSAFPGIDRCIVLLRGAGMRLRSADGRLDHLLDRPLTPFHFSGDMPLAATVLGGQSSDFNVMTRRGAWSYELAVERHASVLRPADVTLLLCCAGEWRVDAAGVAEPLRHMQALLWRARSAPLAVQPAGPAANSALLHVRLCHDHAP